MEHAAVLIEHEPQLPLQPWSFSALQRGQRICAELDGIPHDGHGVTDPTYTTPSARESSPPTRNAITTELANSPAM